jgi:hypothetical protein
MKMSFEDRIKEHYRLDFVYANSANRKDDFLRKKEYLKELISIIESSYWDDKGIEVHFFCGNTTKVPTFIQDVRDYLNAKEDKLQIEVGINKIEDLAREAQERSAYYRHPALTSFINYINTPIENRPLQFPKPKSLQNKMQIETDLPSIRKTVYGT